MGLFSKKRDPISERASELNDQIAALEAQIKELSQHAEETPFNPSPAPPASAPQPRLRSTARPHGPLPIANPAPEPVFEEVDQERLQRSPEQETEEPENDLGTRRNDLASLWRRWKNHFRGPATTNPKLVSYLAAGSIQGLRPLRYEKRVARNRFIVLCVVLALALWGLFAIFLRKP